MNTSGPLNVVKNGDVTVVEFGPDQRHLDEVCLERIGRQLVDIAQDASPPLLVFDMSATEFFGSSFIEALFRVWKKLSTQAGARFSIVGLQPYCREVLEITHLDKMWPLYSTQAEAISSISAK